MYTAIEERNSEGNTQYKVYLEHGCLELPSTFVPYLKSTEHESLPLFCATFNVNIRLHGFRGFAREAAKTRTLSL